MAKKAPSKKFTLSQVIKLIRFASEEVSEPNQNTAGLCKEYFHPPTCPVSIPFLCLNLKTKEFNVLDESFGRTALVEICLYLLKEKEISNEELREKIEPYLINCWVTPMENKVLLKGGIQKTFLRDIREGILTPAETYRTLYIETLRSSGHFEL